MQLKKCGLSPYKFLFKGQSLWLSSERCIFWENEKALILSDLHFGKTGHFRKSGIPVPQNVFKEDLQRLFSQVQFYKADTLIIVGDLFHSRENKEMDLFLKWRNDHPSLELLLVKGNHDILSRKFYELAGIEVFDDSLLKTPFCFTHDISLKCDDIAKADFTFSGHIHPGIRINGVGKQSLHFPCFYFNKDFAVLPAFSRFTGLASIRPERGDKVFALIENNVLEIQ